jgi:hypothetical protein
MFIAMLSKLELELELVIQPQMAQKPVLHGTVFEGASGGVVVDHNRHHSGS